MALILPSFTCSWERMPAANRACWSGLASCHAATYYNVPFCGGTGIGYNANNVYGRSDGSAWGWVNTWDYGCNASWLWYGTFLEWG
jgi:hypothetical protein